MSTPTRKILKGVVESFAKLLLVAGGALFLFGDKAMHEFTKVPFWLAETEGIGLGLLCILIGTLVKGLAENFDVPDDEGDSDHRGELGDR